MYNTGGYLGHFVASRAGRSAVEKRDRMWFVYSYLQVCKTKNVSLDFCVISMYFSGKRLSEKYWLNTG